MGFVAFSWSRLSSDVCYDTCPAWGALPLRPSPSARSSDRARGTEPSERSQLEGHKQQSEVRENLRSPMTNQARGILFIQNSARKFLPNLTERRRFGNVLRFGNECASLRQSTLHVTEKLRPWEMGFEPCSTPRGTANVRSA